MSYSSDFTVSTQVCNAHSGQYFQVLQMIHVGESSKDPRPSGHSALQELAAVCPPCQGPGTLGLASESRRVVVFGNSTRERKR
jgi:hypothetical protein